MIINELLDYAGKFPEGDIICFTANQVTAAKGLVMGAGNAKACKLAHPLAPRAFAGLKTGFSVKRVGDILIGALATKKNWKDPSELEFVLDGMRALYRDAKANPTVTYHVPYPAIGRGGLDIKLLEGPISTFPDNVLFYKK